MIFGVLRRAIGLGPCEPIQESAWAFQQLMANAQQEIEAGGELKPARVIKKGPDMKKVHIGLFAAKVLRMKRRSA